MIAGSGAILVVVVVVLLLVARRRYTIVTVDGASMRPTLEPGDRVLVRRGRPGRLRPGQLVVARRPWPGQRWNDPQPGPEADATWLIKRVADGPSPEGTAWLLGDNAGRSWDSRQWGPCPREKVRGVVVTVFRPAPRDRPAPAGPPR